MSVTNTTTVSPLYTGNGVTTAFSTVFHFSDNAEVLVYLVTIATGVETLQTITTHYTLAGAGTGAAGTATFVTAPTSLQYVKMERSTPLTQATDYVEGTKFPASTHENALDKLTRIAQETETKISRAPLLPVSSSNYPLVFPDFSVATANYLLQINTAGTALQLAAPTTSGSTAAGGVAGSVQYNSAGAVAGDVDFTYDGSGTAFLSTSLNLGHATDTTITRASAGDIAVEGNTIYRTGGTDVVVADGGTGVSSLTAFAPIFGGTTSTGAVQSGTAGTSGQVLTSNGAGVLPSFQTVTVPTAAAQADQETATSTTTYVSPGRQQFHPSACKAWIQFTSVTTTAILTSYNITSVTDNGSGDTTITIATDFSGGNYAIGTSTGQSTGIPLLCIDDGSSVPTAGTLRVQSLDMAGNAGDSPYSSVVMFGDQ
jgi:hypothetical protein